MKRIIDIEIAGTKYPLNFSTKAAREVSERYGSLENVGEAFDGKGLAETLGEIVWLLALLMEQGAAYAKIINGTESKALTNEQLEVVLGLSDVVGLKETIIQAMGAGMAQEVEAEPAKNAKATQSS